MSWIKNIKEIMIKKRLILELVITPFSPEPLTPMMYEKANIEVDFCDYFRKIRTKSFRTEKFIFNIRPQINCRFTLLKRLIINRGSEKDAGLVKFIACNKKFNLMVSDKKMLYMIKNYGIEKFSREYEIGEFLESSYLQSYIKPDLILKLAKKCREDINKKRAV